MKKNSAGPQKFPTVGLVHVDLDNLWTVADCYGVRLQQETDPNFLYAQAIPALLELFDSENVKATFFAVGKDLEHAGNVGLLKQILSQGHQLASHSWEHKLNWRHLSEDEMESDIVQTERIFEEKLQTRPWGFRTPGYAFSPITERILNKRDYLYDSSLMPSPWGWVFRAMDKRMAGKQNAQKTQFPIWRDSLRSLRPYQYADSNLWQLPVATSPVFRLPIQAGVCMRLGMPWMKLHMTATRKLNLPGIFLMHLTDIADFSAIKESFFQQQPFFRQPVNEKASFLKKALQVMKQTYGQIELTEEIITDLNREVQFRS